MGKLAEYVRTEAEHLKAEIGRRKEAVAEWKGAIDRLHQQLAEWVAEADGGHNLLLARPERLAYILEPRLGGYEIQCLRIALGSREVEVAPRARYVAARIKPPGEDLRQADGIADIKSNGIAEYHLFRLTGATPEGDRWFIKSVTAWNASPDDDGVEPLDRDRFEEALFRILR